MQPQFKAIVYYIDNNARTYYSRDKNNKGVERLIKYIKKMSLRINTAIIYEISTGKEIHKFVKGRQYF